MISTYKTIACDNCTLQYDNSLFLCTAEPIRRAAKAEGWTRGSQTTGADLDLCRTCSTPAPNRTYGARR
jgi:hypothetical protein